MPAWEGNTETVLAFHPSLFMAAESIASLLRPTGYFGCFSYVYAFCGLSCFALLASRKFLPALFTIRPSVTLRFCFFVFFIIRSPLFYRGLVLRLLSGHKFRIDPHILALLLVFSAAGFNCRSRRGCFP